jgi:hypothetical protein
LLLAQGNCRSKKPYTLLKCKHISEGRESSNLIALTAVQLRSNPEHCS